ALAVLTSSQDYLGWTLGVDQLLARDPDGGDVGAPGRMAPSTALGFILAGGAIVALRRRDPGPAQALAALLTMLAVLLLLGYLYGAPLRYRLWDFYSSSPLSGLLLLVLGVGLLAARTETGWMRELARDTASAATGRRMIAAVVVILPALGLLRLHGERAGLY